MESRFNLPIHLDYYPPAWLFPVLTMGHTGAIICVFAVAVPSWLKLVIVSVISLSFFHYVKDFIAYRNPENRIRLILNIENEWKIIDCEGDREVMLLPGAYVHPLLMVLRFRDENKQVKSFILTPGPMDRDSLRRLRVRLRFGK